MDLRADIVGGEQYSRRSCVSWLCRSARFSGVPPGFLARRGKLRSRGSSAVRLIERRKSRHSLFTCAIGSSKSWAGSSVRPDRWDGLSSSYPSLVRKLQPDWPKARGRYFSDWLHAVEAAGKMKRLWGRWPAGFTMKRKVLDRAWIDPGRAFYGSATRRKSKSDSYPPLLMHQ
jgi:hypothetical protein